MTLENPKLVFISDTGERYRDQGNAHTLIVKAALILFLAVALYVFNWTLIGYIFVFAAEVFAFILQGYLRYFWTSFSKIDENGIPIEKKKGYLINKYSKPQGSKPEETAKTGEKGCKERVWYKGWLKALVALGKIALITLEIAVMLAAVTEFYVLSVGSYHSRYYLSFNNKQPVISEDQYLKTLAGNYQATRSCVNELCPEAVLTSYSLVVGSGEQGYYFLYENLSPDEGLFRKTYSTLWFRVLPDERYINIDFNNFPESYSPVPPPDKEIDTSRVLDIVSSNTGIPVKDIVSYDIATAYYTPYAPDITDPGGDTWAVTVFADQKLSYYIVDIAKGTAEKEDM